MSARNRATYNWHVLRSIGEKLRDVFEADVSKPLPDRIATLMSRFEEAERDTKAHPVDAAPDDTLVPPSAAPPS